MLPQINSKKEIFDIDLFNKRIDPISGKRSSDNDLEYIEQEEQSYGYISRCFYKDNYFALIKKYYKTGIVKEKVISFNNGHPVGVLYKYDKQGKLIKETNTDEGYTFGWQKIINYCREHKIPLTKGYQKGGSQTEIYKSTLNAIKVWKINYLQTINDFPYSVEITLDGQTGELINKKQAEFE